MTQKGGFDLLPYVRPILGFVPEVLKSSRMVPLKDKLIWTILTLFIFLICS